jgi:glutamine cyclotransferase
VSGEGSALHPAPAGAGFVLASVAALVVATGCVAVAHAYPGESPGTAVPVLRATVLAEIPHDAAAYTEGLELDGAILWEGTGKSGQSELRQLDPATGAVRRAVPLPGNYVGEGITVVNDRVWQLTYRDGVIVALSHSRATPVAARIAHVGDEGTVDGA